MKALSLFSGVGGLDLAAEAAGIEAAAMCEIEPFCASVLNKRWPNVPVIDDVRKVNERTTEGAVDIVFGGFPCQDLSTAGNINSERQGLEGERSGLWFEMLRVIRGIRPCWVLAENVRGAVNLALDTVKDGLEAEGYQVWPFVLPASAFGAPHRRERLFIVGARADVTNAASDRLLRGGEPVQAGGEELESPAHGIKDTCKDSRSFGNRGGDACELEGQLNPDWVEQLMGFPEGWTNLDREETAPWQGFPAPISPFKNWATPCSSDCVGSCAPSMGRSIRNDVSLVKKGKLVCPQHAYEFPRLAKGVKMRKERIKALGNAVVPQQAYPLFKAIAAMHKEVFV